ncbi:uncharacterized protein RCC_05903 [Ramularia collo-cygni]|uniref:Hypercellular protein (HypA) n=1 Tax=Ramularia collo-cygni TaxID=112498 RepID=A0A2D3V8V7_9PEZI|nr:uncharacterized protein RCC_05903 [Ramularia collo-cygni]CZT20046.1 uncharacterized protein RCC_05903 [Ramularia collo-cygni]
MDHFSPVAPAYIRVLVLPVGQIESSRFSLFVRRLQSEASIVSLSNVEHQGNGDVNSLSPTTFPQGSLLYRFSAAAPSEEHEKISPYEFFREPLIILGVVDGWRAVEEDSKKQLAQATAYLRERHPRVVHRQLVWLEDGDDEDVKSISSEIRVTNANEVDHPSLRSAVNELSARFLVEFSTYAKAVQASPTIQTPGHTAKGLHRHSSLRESERRPGSGHGDSSHASSPVEDGRTSDSFPTGKLPPLPATSFDQMPSANNVTSTNYQRRESEISTQSSKSKTRARSFSQDRIQTQGFGQSSSQEKTRARGKARVGIVMGSIYMMSGQWQEALRLLAESTTISNALTDHLWHAKGLENMLVCMVLLFWSGTEFKVPKLCDLALDKASASKFSRGASNPPGVSRESAESAKDKSQGHRLSVVIPGLARKILSLLRSTEGSLELPSLVFAEASVRFAKLLATLNATNGDLTYEKVRGLVVSDRDASSSNAQRLAVPFVDIYKPYSKASITEILSQAIPFGGDVLATSDHIRLLAGIASAYSVIGYDRKKAMAIKDAVTRLTGALMQARKLGAAEMGIHPAASLSIDTGADTLLAVAAEGSGLGNLMIDLSNIYGASTLPSSRTDSPIFADINTFGNPAIKFEILRALSGFCEAAPDPEGVLLMTSALLRAAGPNAAIDAAPEPVCNAFSREEQMHLATVISRTVAVSKHLGLANVQAVYWDSFLVRAVELIQPTGTRAVLDRTKLNGLEASIDQLGPGNPLLYDPNASRPGTAVKQASVLIHGEQSECVITLQNPFDIPLDIEEVSLVTDGLQLTSQHEPTTLGPMRFQQVSLMVDAAGVGSTKITGCRIKMQGCISQIFPIVTKSWAARPPLTTKNIGLDARPKRNVDGAKDDLRSLGIEFADVPVTVIEGMPSLVFEPNPQLDSGFMLLEGELHSLTLQLRNISKVSASVFEVVDSADVLRLERDEAAKRELVVPPGAVFPFHFQAYGTAGIATTQVNFYYAASGQGAKHARVTTVSLGMTVNAALQVQNVEIMRSLRDPVGVIQVSLDARNAWPRSLSYVCQFDGDEEASADGCPISKGYLAPGEVRRVHQVMPDSTDGASFDVDVEKARQRFLSRFRLKWEAGARSGVADLQTPNLSPESLRALQGPSVQLAISVVGHEASSKVKVAVGSFVRVQVTMKNLGRRGAPLHLQLRDLMTHTARPDRWYLVAGSLKRLLSPMAERQQRAVEFLICPLLAGALDLEVRLGELDPTDRINWHSTRLQSLTVYEEERDEEGVGESEA